MVSVPGLLVSELEDDEFTRVRYRNLSDRCGLRIQAFSSREEILAVGTKRVHGIVAGAPDAGLGRVGEVADCESITAALGWRGHPRQHVEDGVGEEPLIFITGHGDVPMTVQAMKGRAVEFLTKVD